MPAKSQGGGIIGKATQYGYANDSTPDYNSNVLKIGMRDNPLTPHAAALTKLMQRQINAQPGDAIETIDGKGNKHVEYFADRAPESDARIDFYKPQGFDKSLDDSQQVIDLGGGDSRLSGKALAAAGEANVARLGGLVPNQNQIDPSPVSAPNSSVTGIPATVSQPIASPAPSTAPSLAWPMLQNNIAPTPSVVQNAPAMQSPKPQMNPDAFSSFYANHPVFATLGGI